MREIEEWHTPRKETIERRILKGWPRSTASKKIVKYISLRRFEKMIGVAPIEKSSGQEKKKKIRRAGEGKPIKIKRMKVAAKIARRLFNELVKKLSDLKK